MQVKELFDLTGKVAVITGGSKGLGRQMAFGLSEAGANVVICARKMNHCKNTAEEIIELGCKAIPIKCDISSSNDIDSMVEKTIKKYGKIDILVNNAGAVWGASPEEMKIENWMKIINVNILGTFYVSQAIGKFMIKEKNGSIINISSVTGFMGSNQEIQDAIAYNTTKGAINTFTKDLAVKWIKHGIRVNAIAPGWFPTALSRRQLEKAEEKIIEGIPMRRFGNEYELKGAAVFLASEASSYVTGHILVVDGGFLAC